jgi:hypothetical protein
MGIMTNEEQKGLCENLREPWRLCDDVDADLAALMTSAADEIERLDEELQKAKQLIISLINKGKEYIDHD